MKSARIELKGAPDSLAHRAIGATVRLQNVSKRYGKIAAVDDVSLDIEPGEFVTLLGPSGSGKTTLLMAVAGFTEIDDGRICVAERRCDQLPPHRRDLGVVFQHLALFPHMNVADNVAFPLRMRGMDASEVTKRTGATLELVHLAGFERRLPSELSGGQQQRVALARAIVFSPPVLLLDEPLSALDRKLREQMQLELKTLHRTLGITILHVTHDQLEALALSDRVAIMQSGRIEQIDTPQQLFERPLNRFVADFVGESNIIQGQVIEATDTTVLLLSPNGLKFRVARPAKVSRAGVGSVLLRPGQILLNEDAKTADNRYDAEVSDLTFAGETVRYRLKLFGSVEILAVQPHRSGARTWARGSRVIVGWKMEDGLLLAADDQTDN